MATIALHLVMPPSIPLRPFASFAPLALHFFWLFPIRVDLCSSKVDFSGFFRFLTEFGPSGRFRTIFGLQNRFFADFRHFPSIF